MKSFLTLMLLLLLFPSCSGNLLIGVSLTQSGEQSILGVDIRDGILLAAANLESKRKFFEPKLELVLKDDENSLALALSTDKKLLDLGVRAVLGHATSALSLEVLPLFNERNIALVSPTASSRALAGLDDCFFRLVSSNDHESAVLAEYAISEWQTKNVVSILDASNHVYGISYADDFESVFREKGLRAPQRLMFASSKDFDYQGFLSKSQEILAEADCILFICAPLDLASFAQSYRLQGGRARFLSSGWAKSSDTLRHGGIAVEGLVFSEMFDQESTAKAFLDFKKQFSARYGREPSGAAVQGYESLMYVQKALSSKSLFQSDISSFKNVRELEGLQGSIRFTPTGDALRPSSIVAIENGNFIKRK
ncbi:ABC transporter substrate-binding protein [Treponema sp.]